MVIHEPVMEPPGMFFGMIRDAAMDQAIEDYVDKAAYKAKRIFGEAVEYCRKKKIELIYEVARGHAAEEILKFSKKNDINLIIMGSKGHRSIVKTKALGSISRHVVENSTCPVMIIH